MFNLEMTEPAIDLFNEFWANYPRKCAKKKAKQAFDKLTPIEQGLAIKDCQTRFNGVEKIFIPHPTSYLNGARWEDEAPIVPMPRTNDEWDAEGKRLGISPRRGETYPKYKDRIKEAMNN